jgi:hypothetical protein
MDPQTQCCPNEHCSATGVHGGGNIRSPSQQKGR